MSVPAATAGVRGDWMYGCMNPASPPAARAASRYGLSSAGCEYAVPPCPADERKCELPNTQHPDVAEPTAEFLRVLKNVRGRRQRMRLAGEVRPPTHQARPVHVDERIGDVQIFGDEL